MAEIIVAPTMHLVPVLFMMFLLTWLIHVSRTKVLMLVVDYICRSMPFWGLILAELCEKSDKTRVWMRMEGEKHSLGFILQPVFRIFAGRRQNANYD